jgi:hypothetical protein
MVSSFVTMSIVEILIIAEPVNYNMEIIPGVVDDRSP